MVIKIDNNPDSGIMPRFLWPATGRKSMINERLLVLKCRKIVAYPDIDGYSTWIEKLAQFPDLHVTVSPILQRNATTAAHPAQKYAMFNLMGM